MGTLTTSGTRAPCVQWQNISLSERQDAILQLQRVACGEAIALD